MKTDRISTLFILAQFSFSFKKEEKDTQCNVSCLRIFFAFHKAFYFSLSLSLFWFIYTNFILFCFLVNYSSFSLLFTFWSEVFSRARFDKGLDLSAFLCCIVKGNFDSCQKSDLTAFGLESWYRTSIWGDSLPLFGSDAKTCVSIDKRIRTEEFRNYTDSWFDV